MLIILMILLMKDEAMFHQRNPFILFISGSLLLKYLQIRRMQLALLQPLRLL